MDPTRSAEFLSKYTPEPLGDPIGPEPSLEEEMPFDFGEACNIGSNVRVGVVDHRPLWRGSAWYATVRLRGTFFDDPDLLSLEEMIVSWDPVKKIWSACTKDKGVRIAQYRFTPEIREMIEND